MDGFWSIAKDVAGFTGALCLFVPWIRDYRVRRRLHRVKSIPSRLPLKERLRQRRETWLARPKRSDLIICLAGIGLIAISFGISLLISLKLLPA